MQRSPAPAQQAPAPSRPPRQPRPAAPDDWKRSPPWCALTDEDDELALVAIRTCN